MGSFPSCHRRQGQRRNSTKLFFRNNPELNRLVANSFLEGQLAKYPLDTLKLDCLRHRILEMSFMVDIRDPVFEQVVEYFLGPVTYYFMTAYLNFVAHWMDEERMKMEWEPAPETGGCMSAATSNRNTEKKAKKKLARKIAKEEALIADALYVHMIRRNRRGLVTEIELERDDRVEE